jgi:hypothetical protein
MGYRTAARSSPLPRVTFWMSVAAGIAEAAATVAANDAIDVEAVAYITVLVVPFGFLAWLAHRNRERRILKPLLFLAVLCLAAWGLSQLVDDAIRFHNDPEHRKVQRWAVFGVLLGNWITVLAMWWAERFLSRFSRPK